MHIRILILLFFVQSCQSNEPQGIWFHENVHFDNSVLAHFSEDSLTVKILSSFNYYMSNEPMHFKLVEKNTYENDSFKIVIHQSDSLEMKTYKNDRLIEVEKFFKLKQLNSTIDVNDLKTKLFEKSLEYKMEDYQVNADIIDSQRIYNYNVISTPIGFGYYDLFRFGSEVFILLNTEYPLPIQLGQFKTVEDHNVCRAYLRNEEGVLKVSSFKPLDQELIGRWSIKNKNSKNLNSIKDFNISPDSIIINLKTEHQYKYELNRLSENNLYCLKSGITNPFLIRIDQNDDEIEITNFRNRTETKMILMKDK